MKFENREKLKATNITIKKNITTTGPISLMTITSSSFSDVAITDKNCSILSNRQIFLNQNYITIMACPGEKNKSTAYYHSPQTSKWLEENLVSAAIL